MNQSWHEPWDTSGETLVDSMAALAAFAERACELLERTCINGLWEGLTALHTHPAADPLVRRMRQGWIPTLPMHEGSVASVFEHGGVYYPRGKVL